MAASRTLEWIGMFRKVRLDIEIWNIRLVFLWGYRCICLIMMTQMYYINDITTMTHWQFCSHSNCFVIILQRFYRPSLAEREIMLVRLQDKCCVAKD